MTAHYPPASDDAPEQGAADLSYADVAAPETSARSAEEMVRTYAWPSAPTLEPALPSEADSVVGSEPDSNSRAYDDLSIVDQNGTVSEVEHEPSTVEQAASGPGAIVDESAMDAEPAAAQADWAVPQGESSVPQGEPAVAQPESAVTEVESPATQAESAADPEPADPAVARMRAVQARLGELDDLPIGEHPARYEELHAELTGALAQIDRVPDSQA